MKNNRFEEKTSEILSAISNPYRIRILLVIGSGEACVCHLESVLKKRQSFISQHLMALRNAGILETRRDGKYIFYRLAAPEMHNLIRMAGKLAGLDEGQIPELSHPATISKCECPNCVAG